jgi:hypothetical protein
VRLLSIRITYLSFCASGMALWDGRRVVVDYPSVAFSDGAAGFISETEGLIPFTCDEVQAISQATAEANP